MAPVNSTYMKESLQSMQVLGGSIVAYCSLEHQMALSTSPLAIQKSKSHQQEAEILKNLTLNRHKDHHIYMLRTEAERQSATWKTE